MLSKGSMFDVDESVDESNSLDKDPITSNELDEDEVEHDPFEFLHYDKIPFSRLLFDSIVWQVQGFYNGDVNPNKTLLNDDVQMFYAPPQVVHAPPTPSQDMSMQSMNSMEVNPPS